VLAAVELGPPKIARRTDCCSGEGDVVPFHKSSRLFLPRINSDDENQQKCLRFTYFERAGGSIVGTGNLHGRILQLERRERADQRADAYGRRG
jgi:hypothetical protein